MPERTPRDWQLECLRAWEGNGFRGIARVATGAGKTYLGILAARMISDRTPDAVLRARIVVPTLFLAAQWRGDLREAGIAAADIGLYNGPVKEGPNRPFMIYVVNTARHCLARHILDDFQNNHATLLICDECHHVAAPENRRIFEFYLHISPQNYYALGLSATPDPSFGTLPEALGGEFFRYDIADALRDGIVADFVFFSIALNFTPDEAAAFDDLTIKITRLRARLLKASPRLKSARGRAFFAMLTELSGRSDTVGATARALAGAYRERREISHLAPSRIACSVALARNLADKRVILFAERIETAEILYDDLANRRPGRVGRYHSAMPPEARRAALERFRTGETTTLLCCRALDEGLNVPDADVGIVVSSTGNERQHIQRLGRVLRRQTGRDAHAGPKALYYLYIPDSGEPQTRLASAPVVCNLTYDEQDGFVHPVYDALAERARERLKALGASPQKLAAADACIAKGRTRADFLLPPEECRRRAETAAASERDYWIAMALIVAIEPI